METPLSTGRVPTLPLSRTLLLKVEEEFEVTKFTLETSKRLLPMPVMCLKLGIFLAWL